MASVEVCIFTGVIDMMGDSYDWSVMSGLDSTSDASDCSLSLVVV